MDTRSAAMPVKVSVSTQTLTWTQGLGLRWHRDILAAKANLPDPGLVTAQLAPGSSTPSTGTSVPSIDMKSGENTSGDSPKQVMSNQVVMSSAANKAVPGTIGAVEISRAHEAVGTAIVATPQAFPSSLKREAKKSDPTTSVEVVNLQSPIPSDVTVVATRVEANISAPIYGVDTPHNRTSQNSGSEKTVSAATKPAPSSNVAESGKETAGKLDSRVVEGHALEPAKQVATLIGQSKPKHDVTAPSVLSTCATVALATSDSASSSTNSPHLNQAVALSTVAQTIAPNHAASPSALGNLHLVASSALNDTGVTGLHVMPSAPTRLDVGVLDGTHGWLRIRAELGAAGAVSASLTASALAHESLRATLPEMARYLGSEAISVTALAVHRFAATASTSISDAATSQQNGDSRDHNPRGEAANEDGSDQKHHTTTDNPLTDNSAPTTTRRIVEPEMVAAAGSGAQMQTLYHGTARHAWPFEMVGGFNGSWLNVCA